MNGRDRIAAWAALVLSVVGISLGVTVDKTDNGSGHTTTNLTFHVDRSGQPGVQPAAVSVPATAVQATQAGLETHLRAESPPGTTDAQQNAIEDAQARIAEQLPPLPTAGAVQSVPGCVTHFIGSYSDRHGVRPTQFWLHYTVSKNVPGWSDVWAVVYRFANRGVGASSHFVIDAEGHCAYIVPIEFKAWTQAGGNAFGINFEIIDYGNETTYMQPAGFAKLRSVLRVLSSRTGIPLQRGIVHNCVPVKAGIVQHFDGGPCSGGHIDVTPFKIDDIVKILAARQPVPKKVRWIRHRRAVHLEYVAKCPRHRGSSAECKQLRATGRLLDHLIARKA